MLSTGESPPKGTVIANAIAVSPAAVANHFNWSRSSPAEPLNRTTVDANAVRIVSGNATSAMMNRTISTVFMIPPVLPLENGSFHDAVEEITATTSSMLKRANVKTSTRRHLGEGIRPVGNQRNRSTKALNGRGQRMLAIQPARFPPGRDPGLTAASRTDENFHDCTLAGRLAWRSMKSRTRPPSMSTVETTPTTIARRRIFEGFTVVIMLPLELRREPCYRELPRW